VVTVAAGALTAFAKLFIHNLQNIIQVDFEVRPSSGLNHFSIFIDCCNQPNSLHFTGWVLVGYFASPYHDGSLISGEVARPRPASFLGLEFFAVTNLLSLLLQLDDY
jgi:hypothetical protein